MNRNKQKSTCLVLDFKKLISIYQLSDRLRPRDCVTSKPLGHLATPTFRLKRGDVSLKTNSLARPRMAPDPNKISPWPAFDPRRFQIRISRTALWISCCLALVDHPKPWDSCLLDGASSGFGRLSGRSLVKYCICCTSQKPKFGSLLDPWKDRKSASSFKDGLGDIYLFISRL